MAISPQNNEKNVFYTGKLYLILANCIGWQVCSCENRCFPQHLEWIIARPEKMCQTKVWNKNDCQRSKTRSKHIKDLKERYLFRQDKTANFGDNPLCQATRWYLTNKNDEKWSEKIIFHCFWPFRCCLSFCSLTKGTTLKICWFCLVLINSILLNVLCVWNVSDSWRLRKVGEDSATALAKSHRVTDTGTWREVEENSAIALAK